MTTFFTILFILLGINGVMMLFSLSSVKQNAKKLSKNITESTTSKIYPIDLIAPKYKKAV